MTPSEMNTEETLHKLLKSRRLIRLFNALLVLWLVWLVANAAWQHFQPDPEPEVTVAAPLSKVATPQQLPADQMADWHPFGIADEQEKTNMKRMLNAPETKLKLSLKGIVATDNHLDGYAIIQKYDKEEQHFKVKDSVFGLATLEEIYIDRVILLRGERYETLKLPVEFIGGKHFTSAQRKLEQKKVVTDFRKLLVSRKGMDLIKLFGFDTTYKNGGFYGFIIKVLGEDGQKMIDTLGVEEGDIIVAVNGERFAESIQAVNNLTKLKDATSVNVEVDRKGTHLFFDLEFDETVPADTPADTPPPQQDSTDELAENPESTEKQ